MTKQSNYPAHKALKQLADKHDVSGEYYSAALGHQRIRLILDEHQALLTTQQQLEDMVRKLMHRLDTFVRFDALLPGMPNNKADLMRQSTEAIQQATNLLEKK